MNPTTDRQVLSKRLFAAQYRLDAAATLRGLERDASVDHEAFVQLSGLPRTVAFKELKVLTDACALGFVTVDRRNLYYVVPGPFWEWIGQLLDQTLEAPVPDQVDA